MVARSAAALDARGREFGVIGSRIGAGAASRDRSSRGAGGVRRQPLSGLEAGRPSGVLAPSPDALVNITYIIGLTGNSQENTPVDGLWTIRAGICPNAPALTPSSSVASNRRVRHRRLDRPMRRIPFQLGVRLRRTPPRRTPPTRPAPTPRSDSRHGQLQHRARRDRRAAGPALGPRRRRRPPGPRTPVSRPARLPHREADPGRLQELQRDLEPLAQQVHDRPRRVDPDEEPLAVEAEPDGVTTRRRPVGLVHRAGDVPDLERARAQPLEVARLLAVERRRQQRRPARVGAGAGAPVEMLLTNSSSGIGFCSSR